MTEKNYNPEQKRSKTMRKQEKAEKQKQQVSETSEEKKEETEKKEKQKPLQKKPKVKKTEAVVRGINLPISTKYSSAVCKFIKGKTIDEAIEELEKVVMKKKAVPVKGEISHKRGIKGVASGSGKYPVKVAKNFLHLLKSVSANAVVNEIENPIIIEAVANIASRPYGRFGSVRRKRTHVKITVKEKKLPKGEKE